MEGLDASEVAWSLEHSSRNMRLGNERNIFNYRAFTAKTLRCFPIARGAAIDCGPRFHPAFCRPRRFLPGPDVVWRAGVSASAEPLHCMMRAVQ